MTAPTPLFGTTRTRILPRHALITPDGHVASIIPGIDKARVVAHITPAMGAGFAQSTITFEAGGKASFPASGLEYVFYVLEGNVHATAAGQEKELSAGMFFYLAPQEAGELTALKAGSQLAVFEKKYVPSATAPAPKSLFGNAARVPGQAFLGNPKAQLQVLLPEDPAFDLAVNVFTYQPGTTLPFVETHIMEHGLLMLSGQGVYRLENEWYPVTAGDVIWMAPYCPQWFVAMGDTPASYLYYKDVHRPLL